MAAAAGIAREKLLDQEVIPAPHDELDLGLFVRTWPLDPADPAPIGRNDKE